MLDCYYAEVVTHDVDGVCKAYSALGAEFGEPIEALGGARTAQTTSGGMVGVRAPMRDDEPPTVRPYWLVPDAQKALDAAVSAGGSVAMPVIEIPGVGTFAIYQHGGIDHGIWEKR